MTRAVSDQTQARKIVTQYQTKEVRKLCTTTTTTTMSKPLASKVCLVTGATRGMGKGIALQLCEAGATVYITGRTLKRPQGRVGGSLEDTVKEAEGRGGQCIPVQCDHTDDVQISAVFDRIRTDTDGVLDVLVNNAYAGVDAIFANSGESFWEQKEDMWDMATNVGCRNHYMCTIHAARMMVPRGQGLIINVSSMGGLKYFFNIPYGVGKAGVDRMAADCAVELRPHNITMVSLWPGHATTEKASDVAEHTPELMDKLPGMIETVNAFKEGESPEFSGHCIVKLIQDPQLLKKTGRILMTSDLGDEYKLHHVEGCPLSSQRGLSWLLHHLGYKNTARLIPNWVKVPHVALHLLANKF